jgi:hypothetical protein
VHLAKKRRGIATEAFQIRVNRKRRPSDEVWIMLLIGPVQPQECLIELPAKGM